MFISICIFFINRTKDPICHYDINRDIGVVAVSKQQMQDVMLRDIIQLMLVDGDIFRQYRYGVFLYEIYLDEAKKQGYCEALPILFLYCNTIFFSHCFLYKKIIKIRIPRHEPLLTINHWRSNRRIINKLILAQCNINRQKKDNYWYYCNKCYLIDNSNNNKCNKR